VHGVAAGFAFILQVNLTHYKGNGVCLSFSSNVERSVLKNFLRGAWICGHVCV
jgi:kynurenine formamidase